MEINVGNLIKQIGDYNETKVVQILNGEMFSQHFVEVEQYGYGNQSEVIQNGFENEAFIEQSNNDNTANIWQYGQNNLLKIKQAGNQNIFGKTTFAQIGNNNKLAGIYKEDEFSFNETGFALQEDGAIIDIMSFQVGTNNVIGLIQGSKDVSLIQQFGNGNETLLWQGGGGNCAQIQQFGNKNSIRLRQE